MPRVLKVGWCGMTSLVAAFSGGKDSTAMVLEMHARGESFSVLWTPTGNELPGVQQHVETIARYVEADLIQLEAPSLHSLIDHFSALPNWRQRWCTRMIKIEPCIVYLKTHPGTTLCVGLRADEEGRQGLYGEFASYRYPLREWGFDLAAVRAALHRHGVTVQRRTDCALCYGQRVAEWFKLWTDYPDDYAAGVEYENMTGHTFRSPARDTWPAGLFELREEFESGRTPKGADQLSLPTLEDEAEYGACRVCTL